ncbi:MAG: RNase adapter RapZ [Cellvibrionales bacterium]|nr:RNase adapter RapZ [Cellvibrionales bacterium]
MKRAGRRAAGAQLVLISGRSGSGKSAALNALEDVGFCCIDNLPARFLPELANMQQAADSRRFAVAVDVRTPSTDLQRLPDLLQNLRPQTRRTILFLDAATAVLVKRFNETRRKHPLTDSRTSLAEALAKESELLAEISEVADLSIQTDQITHYDLRQILQSQLGTGAGGGQQLVIESFGFRYGLPTFCDYMFDVRNLPNPHWVPALRPHNGREQPVIDFLREQPAVGEMQRSIQEFLDPWLAAIFSGSRSYLTVAIGCTGGKHRSVYLADQLHRHFRAQYDNVLVRHRELR